MFIDPDGRKAARGDAQRDRFLLLVTAPGPSWVLVRLFGDSFFGDIVGILCSVWSGVFRRHHPSPALARKPAGQDPGRAFGTLRGRNSDALFPTEVQSLLNYLAFGQIRVANEMRKRGLSISPAGVRACGSAMISRR